MIRPYYSPRQLTRMLRLAPGSLSRWQRLGLFPRLPRYGWADIARARCLRQCEQAQLSPLKLRHSLQALGERMPELTDPWQEAGLSVIGRRLEVHYGGVYMDALTGQMRLPFTPPAVAPAPAAASAQAKAEEAERWFTFGLSLETEPGLRPQAIAAYQHCLELDSQFASAHINLGTLRYHEKDFAAAEACYRAALEVDPNYALAHFNLGNVLDETGRLDTAILSYLEAVRLAPGYADAHYNLALAYQRQGQHRRAVPHWQQYLGLDRTSPWAMHARTQLKQALQRDVLHLVNRDSA